MAAQYINIPSDTIHSFLLSLDFEKTLQNKEIVYCKKYNNTDLVIKVFTSLSENANNVRGCGEDAIRIAVVQGDRGVGRFARVNRSGTIKGVLERIQGRIADAHNRCKQLSQNNNFVGNINQEIRINITIKNCKEYNKKYFYTMQDDYKNTFTYWTDKNLLQIGEMYNLRATVKAHNTFNNIKQTELKNCFGKRIVM